jgi:hypothetical protein
MKAAAAMVEDLEMTLRQRTDEAKLTKKINNMKAAVKKKTDLNAKKNPVFSKVPGIRYKDSFMINY